ncbi:hypothetical protein [Niallia taxi]|nr:hypothetical protein [Niallia taxi]MED3960911.1 hypothetical protein [Niallia taxi]
MRNKTFYGIVFSGSVVAGLILYFAEKRYKKNRKNNDLGKSLD